MRKKPGLREICFYLTEEQYAALERYWRYQTKHRYVSTAAAALFVQVLQEVAKDEDHSQ